MPFTTINYLAVFSAALAAWFVGAIWYGIFGRHWLAALGKTKAELVGPSGKPSLIPMVLSFVADLVIAWSLAIIMAMQTGSAPNIFVGLWIGAIAWFGFVLTTMSVNNAFAGRKPMLTLIDAGHWLAAILVAGVIIGAFG